MTARSLRLKTANAVYWGKVVSAPGTTREPADVVAIVLELLQLSQLAIFGYLSAGDRIKPLPPGGIVELLPERRRGGSTFLLQSEPDIGLRVSWYPPKDPVVNLNPPRLTLSVWAEPEVGWDRMESIFLAAAQASNAAWGELNDEGVAGKASFANVEGEHVSFVAHLGSANYFGPDYVDFFGGIRTFEAAGFHEVRPHHTGVYVRLTPPGCTPAEFSRLQQASQERLSFVPGLFKSGPVPKIFHFPGQR